VVKPPPYRASRSIELRSVAIFFAVLVLIYGAWLMVFWPGILGPDSQAILLEIKNPNLFGSNKTAFWYNYVRLLYGRHYLVELPIGLIMILSTFMMARILGWCWSQHLYRTAVFLLVFICLAPHLIWFMGLLYSDGIFAVATAGLLFEIWLISRQGKAGWLSLFIIAIALPFAAFVRTNGLIFIIPTVILIFMVNRTSRLWVGLIIIGLCSLAAISASRDKYASHAVFYPLAIYETVSFLQPRPLNFSPDERVSQSAVSALTRNHPLELYLSHYDPDYWDPLNYDPNGPLAMALPKQDRNIITKEFLYYNLWHNIPKFMDDRVNIFFVAILAQGGYYGLIPDDSQINILKQVESNSVYRKFNFDKVAQLLKKIHQYDWKYRILLWTPFLGIGLMIWVFCIGIREQDMALLLVSIPMAAQLAGIFIFSVAGEYRYLLHFFTLPLVMLPLLAMRKADKIKTADAESFAHSNSLLPVA
jgi:hypothetical protein